MKALALVLLLPQLALAQAQIPPSSTASGVSGTNTGDVTIGAFGSSPNAKALSISGQVVTAQPADLTHPGLISLSAQTMGDGVKSFNDNILPVTTETLSIGSSSKRWLAAYVTQLIGSWSTPQLIDMSFDGDSINFRTGTGSGGHFQFTDRFLNNMLDADVTGLLVGAARNPVPVVHHAQTGSPVAMEFGRAAAAGTGLLAVSFATAFGDVPSCVCTDENAAPVGCGITVAPTTSAVTFYAGAARADTLDWQCTGLK